MQGKCNKIVLTAAVLIVVISSALAIWFPKWILYRQMRRVLQAQRDIYVAMYMMDDDERTLLGLTNPFPKSTDSDGWHTSTDYWKSLVSQSDSVAVRNFSLFAAPGIKSYGGSDSALFRAENNAHCIVLDLDPSRTPYLTPLIFTRNLTITNLSQDVRSALSDEPPFGRRGVVLTALGGSGHILNERELVVYFEDLRKEWNASNIVLRPE